MFYKSPKVQIQNKFSRLNFPLFTKHINIKVDFDVEKFTK
jgi:hypothetical protein